MKAAIVLDDWKLPVFRKLLTEAGYHYTDAGGLTHNTTVLTVEYGDLPPLKAVIEKCQAECGRMKNNG